MLWRAICDETPAKQVKASVPEKERRSKKGRFRISLRSSAVVLTMVCTYFALWSATSQFGVPLLAARRNPRRISKVAMKCPAPCIIAVPCYPTTYINYDGSIERDIKGRPVWEWYFCCGKYAVKVVTARERVVHVPK